MVTQAKCRQRVNLILPYKDTFLFEKLRKAPLKDQRRPLGGGIEPHESVTAAAARELWEETAVVRPESAMIELDTLDGPWGPETYVRVDNHGLRPGVIRDSNGKITGRLVKVKPREAAWLALERALDSELSDAAVDKTFKSLSVVCV